MGDSNPPSQMYCSITKTYYPLATSDRPGPRVFNSTQDPNASNSVGQPPADIMPEDIPIPTVNSGNRLNNRVYPPLTDIAWYRFDFVDPTSLLGVSDAPRAPWPADVVTGVRIEAYM